MFVRAYVIVYPQAISSYVEFATPLGIADATVEVLKPMPQLQSYHWSSAICSMWAVMQASVGMLISEMCCFRFIFYCRGNETPIVSPDSIDQNCEIQRVLVDVAEKCARGILKGIVYLSLIQ